MSSAPTDQDKTAVAVDLPITDDDIVVANATASSLKHYDDKKKSDLDSSSSETKKSSQDSTPVSGAPPAMDPTKVAVPLGKIPFALTFLGLVLAIFLAALDTTIVATALKAIVGEFGHQDLLPWIGSSYLITACGFTLLYGKLADIFGRKWVFVAAVLVFEIGSVICAAANSMEMMIAGRAIAGIGGGGIFSLVLIIISDIVSMQDRGKYQGMIGAVFGLSSVIGPLIGGAFSDNGLWRWCFYINLPFGAITLAVVIAFLHFPSPPGTFSEKLRRVDFLGAAVMLAAVVCFVTPLQLGGESWAWNAPQTIAMFCAAVVLFALFVFIQLKVAYPMVPPNIFMNQSVYALLVIATCLGGTFFTANYYLAFYFQIDFGVTATTAGLELIPLIFGVVFLSIFSGQFISRTGKYAHFLYIGSIIMTGGLIAISFLNQNSSQALRIVFLLILGVGIGNIIQVRLIAIQASVDVPKIAVATAVSQFCQTVGGAIGIAIFGTVFNNVLASQMASKPELQAILNSPAFNGTDTKQVAYVRLKLSNIPGQEVALNQLLDAFSAAFAVGFRVMIPFTLLMLISAFFVKAYTVKGHGGPPKKPAAAAAAKEEGAAADAEFVVAGGH